MDSVTLLRRALRGFGDRAGATAIEFGLIAGLISLACLIAFQALGLNLAALFGTLARAMGGTWPPLRLPMNGSACSPRPLPPPRLASLRSAAYLARA
jgi:pilus assembly protein Flp/PilA